MPTASSTRSTRREATPAGGLSSAWYRSHDLVYPKPYRDPEANILVEKEPGEPHRQWRARLRLACDRDVKLRAAVMAACARSVDFWCDGFVWSYKQMSIDASGRQTAMTGESVNQPYITWPIHTAFRKEIARCIADGEDLIVPKARDMRASWDFLIYCLHRLLFTPHFSALLMSEKEDKVDSHSGDALFPRLRYVLNRLPAWMKPTLDIVHLHIGNLDNNAAIDGTSSTENAGVGGRRTVIGVDEASLFPYLSSLWDATRDVSRTRVVISTFRGPHFFRDLCMSGRRMFPMGYWDHPDKGRGRELLTDDASGSITGRPNRKYWSTPWFRHETSAGRRSKVDIAQNLLLDPDVGGNTVFDTAVLMRCLARANANPPRHVGDLYHRKAQGESRDHSLRRRNLSDISFVEGGSRTLKLWCPLDHSGRPITQGKICIFADVSTGLGSSNSAIAAIEVDTGRKVAMWADSRTDTYTLGRLLTMLALWFGDALVGWENNGSGQNVERYLGQLRCPGVWNDPVSGKAGWTSTRDGKRTNMEALRDAYSVDTVIDYDAETLQEAGRYVYTVGGGVEIEELVREAQAKAAHGDRVIATMGAAMMARETSRSKPVRTPAPKGSLQRILEDHLAEEKRREDGWYDDE